MLVTKVKASARMAQTRGAAECCHSRQKLLTGWHSIYCTCRRLDCPSHYNELSGHRLSEQEGPLLLTADAMQERLAELEMSYDWAAVKLLCTCLTLTPGEKMR